MRTGARNPTENLEYKLPESSFPTPVGKGLKVWYTDEGWTVVRLHYTADPERADKEWLLEQVKGYGGGFTGRDWLREMEVDFQSYAGEPVYPGWHGGDAISEDRSVYDPGLPLWRGWDFGYRHPACVWAQLHRPTQNAPRGRLVVLAEYYPTLDPVAVPGMTTDKLARHVIRITQELFPDAMSDRGSGVRDFCDPSGVQHQANSEYSAIEVLTHFGIHPEWAKVGKKNRINYLRQWIEADDIEPFAVHPRCAQTIKAIAGGYRYPEEQTGPADREIPDLGKQAQDQPFVHLMDALEYIAACNLQVDWVPRPEAPADDNPNIGTMAELLQGSHRPVDRRGPKMGIDERDPLAESLEATYYDLLQLDESEWER